MTSADRPIDVALAELDRRARERRIVSAVVVLGVTGAAALLLFGDIADEQRMWVAVALAVAVVLYLASMVLEERRTRRTVRALIAEQERAAGLSSRVRALETLHDAAREVAAASDLPEVFTRLVDAALRLTHARSGAVLLRVGDTLTVAASAGPGSPARGTEIPAVTGPAWAAVETGEPVVTGRGAAWGADAESGSVAAPLRLPDRIVGALVVERDKDAPAFTEADRAAVSLFAQHAALAVRNATRRAEDADRIASAETALRDRARAAAEVVHDLRAPVTSMSGYAQLLGAHDSELGPQRRQQIVEDVREELERIRMLLDDLLLAMSADAGTTGPDHEEVDLVDVVHDAARTGRGLVRRAGGGRDLIVRVPSAAPVHGSRSALTRVVTNLVDNAVRYAPPGTSIEVEVELDDAHAVVRVRDHGPGLGGGSTDEGGGLGLQVVRSLVRAHDGEFSLDAAVGGGTVAEVRLPRR